MRLTVLALTLGSLSAADSTTIELHALGGLANGGGQYVAVALASTAYGSDPSNGGGSALVGIAGSLRMQFSQLDVDSAGQTQDIDLSGGELNLGLGMWISDQVTVEVLARFGMGFSSSRGGVSVDSDEGDYDMRGILISGEWTFSNNVQAIIEAGFSRYDITQTVAGVEYRGKGDGLDLGVGVGYRF